MKEEEALKVIIHTINEVTNIDPGVGGEPKIIKITNEKITGYSEKEIDDLTENIGIMQFYVEDLWERFLKGTFTPEFEEEPEKKEIEKEIPPFRNPEDSISIDSFGQKIKDNIYKEP